MTRVKIAIVVSLTAMAVVLAGCGGMAERPSSDLTVMTYNLYIGTELAPLFAVTDSAQLPAVVDRMYNNVVASDVLGRLAAIAKTVKEERPHLIGLQEVSVIRHQANPVLNFREILMSALKAEGLNYEVAAVVENASINLLGSGVTDYDLILARSDVEVTRATSANYTLALPLPIPGDYQVLRGYAAVDATVGGVTYRVVNTHLEATLEALPEAQKQATVQLRVAQAQELVASLKEETLPVILLGDFNTPAPAGPAYQLLLAAEYMDAWQEDAAGSGNTCCQAPDLTNEMSALYKRIDQIFVKGVKLREAASIRTATVGDKPEDRLTTGQWPSDHAGVVAHLPVE